jgi:hypothetical protein
MHARIPRYELLRGAGIVVDDVADAGDGMITTAFWVFYSIL